MAEPFGIASLSIEACKALVSYCDGWRAFDTEIDSVKMKAEGLLSTLQILDKLLNGAHAINPDIAADITLKISQTETWLTKVNNQVAKCSVIQKSSAVDQKLRETAKKAKYPFRRETLKSAANDLRDIHINLNTALLALQIQQAESLRNVEVLEASSMTKIEQYGSRFDKMELAIQGYYVQSQSQLQIASKYPAQRRPASHRYRNTERTKWVRFASRWLRLSVELMVTIENGTQGFALSPTLRFRGIVSKNSPAFNLIRQLTHEHCSPQQNAEISNQAIRSLQRIFDEGRASPGDQTQDGETLITALYFQIGLFQLTPSHLDFLPYYPILRYLIDKGCPIENALNSPKDLISLITSCCMLMYRTDIGSVITKVTEIGFQVTDRNLLGVDSQHFRLAFIHNEESFMISDVTRAILSQSETGLKRLIESGDASPDEYKLCEMCLSWAPGLAILLESTSVVKPYGLWSLLHDAVQHGCPESVKLLLDYGSPVVNSTIWVCHSTETKGRIVFDAFIDRRKHLLELARTMLPEYSQEELCLARALLPDSNAGEIHAQLTRHNILVPSFLQPYSHKWDRDASIFHGPNLSGDDMELLYTAGFRDIDVPDSKGYTPISRAYLRYRNKQSTGEYIERIKWLMSKGARLHSPPTITGSVPSHHISRNITYLLLKHLRLAPETAIKGPQSLWSKCISPRHRDSIELAYGSGHTDNCSCSCSMAGCTPISMALRIILGGPWKYGRPLWLSEKEKACILQQFILDIPSFAAAAHDVLRLITFTDLGLTHTCCCFNFNVNGIEDEPFDGEEAAEIQDEERLLLVDFEGLFEDVIREYDRLGIPLLEYIRTRWCRRVRGYLWKNGEKVDSQSLCNYLDPDFARQWDESMTHEPNSVNRFGCVKVGCFCSFFS